MDKDDRLPFAHIKVNDTMVVDSYGVKGNSLDEFYPRRERVRRGTSHKRETPNGEKKDDGTPPHYSK
jgi:hypothetical protein